MTNMTDKVALITGASSGIGKAPARDVERMVAHGVDTRWRILDDNVSA